MSMKYAVVTVIVILAAGAVVGSALIVRDGLLAIATEIREKPLPEMPEKVTVSDLTIQQATIKHHPNADGQTQSVKLTVENMRIDAQVPQQPAE